jgi:hypothetical protein
MRYGGPIDNISAGGYQVDGNYARRFPSEDISPQYRYSHLDYSFLFSSSEAFKRRNNKRKDKKARSLSSTRKMGARGYYDRGVINENPNSNPNTGLYVSNFSQDRYRT